MILRIRPALLALFAFLALLPHVLGQDVQDGSDGAETSTDGDDDTRWINYQTADGETLYLKDNRRPSLYTDDFGDCLGNSAVNVSRFDAAYYRDNMTIMFHLQGSSGIANEDVVFYIGVYAYGESRFDLVFNPCQANIDR